MIARLFHAWERKLAKVTTDRVVRGFDWGLDWIDANASSGSAQDSLRKWSTNIMVDTDQFFYTPPTNQYQLRGNILTFPSHLQTPHPENNTVHARYFAAAQGTKHRRAVVVLPQWNADPDGHIALSRLIARLGISSLRLSLPYHDQRMPPELHRADYIVSANLGRTLQVCRQAVLDARRAVHWLRRQGYDRIGILGTSLGSCLALLTAAHEPLIKTAALNHISPYFADVVWEGLSTAHVRAGLNGAITLDQLRQLWLPISPEPYISRMRDKQVLLVYARYDLSFPVRLSQQLVQTFQQHGVPHRVFTLPCGHYSTGIAPFSWLDGYVLISFLRKML
jgi:dienelactone hydrolase